MTLLRMALRYASARPALTALNVTAVALGALLISAVLGLNRASRDALTREAGMFDLIVGAKGSPLQLVFSSLYHLDIPTGNMRRETYEKLAADPRVKYALPLGLGDNYAGFRIVGTTPALFVLKNGKDPNPLLRVAEGKAFAKPFEAVVGSEVARLAGLRPGSTFSGTHGVVQLAGSEQHDEFPYTVTGVLAPSGTSFDRAIYTPIESVWLVHEKEDALHDKLKGLEPSKPSDEVTAVLIQLKTRALRFGMTEEIREKTEAMSAIPINELSRFFVRVLEPMRLSLLAVAWVVVLASALSVLATLMQSAERRRRDLAILRCLGARPREILALLLLEGIIITVGGVLLGALAGHGLLQAGAWVARNRSGFNLDAWQFDSTEALALGAVCLVGLLAGLIPGWIGYRRTPARDLSLGGS